jgi:hypothetical protein
MISEDKSETILYLQEQQVKLLSKLEIANRELLSKFQLSITKAFVDVNKRIDEA